MKKYRSYIGSIKKCYPIANNMFNLIARYYGEKEPNDFKWESLEDLKAEDLKQNKVTVDNDFRKNTDNIFINRICSAIIVKTQLAVSKGYKVNRVITSFLENIVKVIRHIEAEL